MALHLLIGWRERKAQPVALYVGTSGSALEAVRAADVTCVQHEIFKSAHGVRKNNARFDPDLSTATETFREEMADALERCVDRIAELEGIIRDLREEAAQRDQRAEAAMIALPPPAEPAAVPEAPEAPAAPTEAPTEPPLDSTPPSESSRKPRRG
ncbi:MAG: hypothetical protein JSR82_24460 [Verrucomicrobia bacterium]|nr:hypothetical protein [Verrucomicrobiota bacterium]